MKTIFRLGLLGMLVTATAFGTETPWEAVQCLYDGAFLTTLVELILRTRFGVTA